MRKNKFVKFLEGILLSLPLLYVGVTCLYVANNKNAKDSFSGDTLNDVSYTEVTNVDNFVFNDLYYFNSETYSYTGNDGGLATFYVGAIRNLRTNYTSNPINVDNIVSFNLTHYTLDYVVLVFNDNTSIPIRLNAFDISFEFYYLNSSINYFDGIYKVNYDNFTFLNNALPYSMSEFNKLGFNKIPFTSFFTNIFHNGETNVYIDFLNSYLNYMLLVECTYVVPMVLYWFIHIGENILERFTHKEF